MNDLAPLQNRLPPQSSMVEAAVARQAQEVQAAMVIAKKFPRDEVAANTRIMNACKRQALAEDAMYAYPRGGQMITGPSIRLAEVLAQCWGNLDFGIIELEQRRGSSEVMAYCWDLETNTRQVKIFTVGHVRATKKGKVELDDPRDIYEMVANQGARRLRACILGIIPGDIQDEAIAACEATLKSGGKGPLIDRVKKMVAAFDGLGVTQEMLAKRLGHNVDTCLEAELVALTKIFKSIRDGMSKREDWFEVASVAKAAEEMLRNGNGKHEEPTPPEPKPDGPTVEQLRERVKESARAAGMSKEAVKNMLTYYQARTIDNLDVDQCAAMLDHIAALGQPGDAAE